MPPPPDHQAGGQTGEVMTEFSGVSQLSSIYLCLS